MIIGNTIKASQQPTAAAPFKTFPSTKECFVRGRQDSSKSPPVHLDLVFTAGGAQSESIEESAHSLQQLPLGLGALSELRKISRPLSMDLDALLDLEDGLFETPDGEC